MFWSSNKKNFSAEILVIYYILHFEQSSNFSFCSCPVGFFFNFYNHSVKILFRAFVTLTLQVTAAQWGVSVCSAFLSTVHHHWPFTYQSSSSWTVLYWIFASTAAAKSSFPACKRSPTKKIKCKCVDYRQSRLQVRLQRVPIKHSTCCKREKILGPGYDE